MITEEILQLTQDGSISEEMQKAVLPNAPPMRWGPATPEQLVAYALKPLLLRGEAVALLQGLTPPTPQFGNEKIYYLDDYADVVQRFLHDCDGGAIPVPCRPLELCKWAITLGVQLPDPFCAAVNSEGGAAPASDPALAIQAGINECSIRPDAISALANRGASAPHAKCAESAALSAEDDRPPPPVRANDDYARWQELAEEQARQYRHENNKSPSKRAVARTLAKLISVEAATIERRTRNTWNPSRRGNRQPRQC